MLFWWRFSTPEKSASSKTMQKGIEIDKSGLPSPGYRFSSVARPERQEGRGWWESGVNSPHQGAASAAEKFLREGARPAVRPDRRTRAGVQPVSYPTHPPQTARTRHHAAHSAHRSALQSIHTNTRKEWKGIQQHEQHHTDTLIYTGSTPCVMSRSKSRSAFAFGTSNSCWAGWWARNKKHEHVSKNWQVLWFDKNSPQKETFCRDKKYDPPIWSDFINSAFTAPENFKQMWFLHKVEDGRSGHFFCWERNFLIVTVCSYLLIKKCHNTWKRQLTVFSTKYRQSPQKPVADEAINQDTQAKSYLLNLEETNSAIIIFV